MVPEPAVAAIRRYVAERLVLQDEFAAPSVVQAGERVSVLGHLQAAGGGGGRSLILFGHPDGEPVSRTDEWTKDLFAAEIRRADLRLGSRR